MSTKWPSAKRVTLSMTSYYGSLPKVNETIRYFNYNNGRLNNIINTTREMDWIHNSTLFIGADHQPCVGSVRHRPSS